MTQDRNLSGCQVFEAANLPSEWDCAPLGSRIELAYGRALREEDRRPGDVDVYGSNGRVGSHDVALVNRPGILIGRKGTIGAVHHANRPFWPIDTVYYVLPLAGDDQRFLHHLFDYLPLALLNAATGVPGLSRRDVYALRGAFPSLNEQIAIARILEAVDTALEKARGVVDRAREFRRALMQELLPPWIGLRELTSSQKPTGIDEIVRADVVTAVCNGSTPSRLEGRYWRQGTIPWLPTGKVHDRIITAADEFVTETALRECSIRLLPRGTVLVGMIGQGRTRGMSAYLDIEACINQNFGAFTPKSAPKLRVLGKWLFYFLDFHCSRVREVGGGTNQGALNCHLLKRLRIPLPSLERQKEVAAILESVESLEKARSNELMLWCDLKESLMHDLLTGRARVRNETRAVVP